ncbi:MAG: hypothetical protein AAGI38_08835 [Bacteroidota bacterium]
MKKAFFSLTAGVLAVLMLTSCNQDKIAALEESNAQLSSQIQSQDSVISDFMTSFNEFSDNLNAIKQRENILTVNTENPEQAMNTRDQIKTDLETINDLLLQNREIIDELTTKADKAEGKSKELRNMVAYLRRQLNEKTEAIAKMEEELVAANFAVKTLTVQVDTLEQVTRNLTAMTENQASRIATQEESIELQNQQIEQQTDALNTGFFVTGTKKELMAHSVIAKDGGFAGLGKASKLSGDFDGNVFQEIDVRAVKYIPVNSRKAKILTSHPSNSYEIKSDSDDDKTVASIEITDPAEFWKASKYLVVVTE